MFRGRPADHLTLGELWAHFERVEEKGVEHLVAAGAQTGRQHERHVVDLERDVAEPGRPVVHGVHGGHVGEQRLGRADVGGGLIPADVLLAGLQREAVGVAAVGVPRDADHAAGHEPHQRLAAREEAGVRAAVAHGHAHALRRAHGDVRAHVGGRPQQRQRQQVRRHHHQGPVVVCLVDDGREVVDVAVGVRVLDEDARHVPVGEVGRVDVDDLDGQAQRVGARLHHAHGLRVQLVGQHQLPPLVLPEAQTESLRCRSALVQERGVGDLHPSQVRDHGLEVEQALQAALCHLWLVGCVLRRPAGVLEDVPHDGVGHAAVVVPHADVRAPYLVLFRHLSGALDEVVLGYWRGNVELRVELDVLWHGL